MSKTRFICARKSRHVDHRGDPPAQKTGLRRPEALAAAVVLGLGLFDALTIDEFSFQAGT